LLPANAIVWDINSAAGSAASSEKKILDDLLATHI